MQLLAGIFRFFEGAQYFVGMLAEQRRWQTHLRWRLAEESNRANQPQIARHGVRNRHYLPRLRHLRIGERLGNIVDWRHRDATALQSLDPIRGGICVQQFIDQRQ